MKTWTYSAIMAYAFVAGWPAYGQMAAPVATNMEITAHQNRENMTTYQGMNTDFTLGVSDSNTPVNLLTCTIVSGVSAGTLEYP